MKTTAIALLTLLATLTGVFAGERQPRPKRFQKFQQAAGTVTKYRGETVTTTPGDPIPDDVLFVTVGPREVWQFKFVVYFTEESQFIDFQAGLTFPQGAQSINWHIKNEWRPPTVLDGDDVSYYFPASHGGKCVVEFEGVIVNGDTAGKVHLNWGRYNWNTPQAVPEQVTVFDTSHVIANRIK